MVKEAVDKDKSVKLKPDDYKIMVDWLETGGKDMLLGGGKAKVGEQNRTKRDGFVALAGFVNKNQKRDSNLVTVDANSMKNRWNFFFKKYRKVKEKATTIGFEVTEEDKNKGIITTQQKLEKLCPQFNRMDAMFGDRVNIEPPGFEETVHADDTTDFSPVSQVLEVLLVTEDEQRNVGEGDITLVGSHMENMPTTPTAEPNLDSARPAKQQKRTNSESAKAFQSASKKVDKVSQQLLNQSFIECSKEKERLKWQMQCHQEKQALEREKLVQQVLMEDKRWEREMASEERRLERESASDEKRWERQLALEAMKLKSTEDLENNRMVLDRERLQQADRAARAELARSALKEGKSMEEIKELLSFIFQV